MGLRAVKVDFPGLLEERLPSGNKRYRVREEGNRRNRITLPVGPDHPDFIDHYQAARAGVRIEPREKRERTVPGSLAWLGDKYIAALEAQVKTGQVSPKTLSKKQKNLRKLKRLCGEFDIDMPPREVVRLRDDQAATPAAADDFVTFLRTMFAWAIEEGLAETNPALGISKIDKGKGGAVPWTLEDLRAFTAFHRPGTTAHDCLTLLLFTGCRIADAAILGKEHEFTFNGERFLGWQPTKKGSARVEVVILPPLADAIDRLDQFRRTYLLTDYGKPFKSGDAMSHRFIKWCNEAGLKNRSAHGVRKALATLLAEMGFTTYHIMSVLGHTEAKTTEHYTETVNRRRLAAEAMKGLKSIEW